MTCQPCGEQHANKVRHRGGRRSKARYRDHGRDPGQPHMQTANDLFGTPQGSPRTDKLIAASIQWATQIMKKIDEMLR